MSTSGTNLPSGTVTFLRTDIEGSMRLIRMLGARYDGVHAQHQALVRAAIATHGGRVVRTEGDAFFAAFEDPAAAVRAAVDIQRAIRDHPWPSDGRISVRVGVHTGVAHLSGDDYGGFEVNRAARIAAAGSGGQIVLSDPVRALVAMSLPPGCSIRDLGRHRLKDVGEQEHLFQLDVAGLPTGFPPLRTGAASTDQLPIQLTSFVGRAEDLDALAHLLASSHLLTLTGPGGTGKTRLALELGHRIADRFPDGAWFVDLQTVTDPSLIGATIARTVGLFDGPSGPAADRLPDHLADRSLLLLLDNFEQIIDGGDVVGELLRVAPGLRVIVTSRAPLRITGEQEYPVPPLALAAPDSDYAVSDDAVSDDAVSDDAVSDDGVSDDAVSDDGVSDDAVSDDAVSDDGDAVRLFIQRARSVRPSLAVGHDERPIVPRICALLDGLPLGIELAAARASSMPLALIHDRLASHLPLPGSGPRDLPQRQRTLDSAIAWSVDLLADSARDLLMRLAVFEGSFDLEQAEAVGGGARSDIDVLEGVVGLVDQSLLIRTDAPGAGARYRLLETIRAFASGRLARSGDEAGVRERHARAYLDLAERAAVHLQGIDQARWRDRLTPDDANLGAAVSWAIAAGDVEVAQRLVAACWRYWQVTGRLNEGRTLISSVMEMPGADAPTSVRIGALDAAGGVAYWAADVVRANALYQEQYDLARRLGDPVAEANAAYNLCYTLPRVGEVAHAMRMGETALQRFAEIGDARGLARMGWLRAITMMAADQVDDAEPLLLALVERFEDLGDAPYAAMAEGGLWWTSMRRGDRQQALHWGRRGLLTMRELGDLAGLTIALPAAAAQMLEFDDPVACATQLGAFEALSERFGVRQPDQDMYAVQGVDPPDVRARAALGDERFGEAFEHGKRLSLNEAIDILFKAAEHAESSHQA